MIYNYVYIYMIYIYIDKYDQTRRLLVLLLLDAFQELQSLHQLCWAKLHGSSTVLAPWREAGKLGEGKVSSRRGNGDWCCLVFYVFFLF